MDSSTALDPETRISVPEARRELSKHHCHNHVEDYDDGNSAIVHLDFYTMEVEVIAKIDNEGNVSSLEIMEWLGY